MKAELPMGTPTQVRPSTLTTSWMVMGKMMGHVHLVLMVITKPQPVRTAVSCVQVTLVTVQPESTRHRLVVVPTAKCVPRVLWGTSNQTLACMTVPYAHLVQTGITKLLHAPASQIECVPHVQVALTMNL